MFAVIRTGGKQYRVVPDDVLEIGKIAGDVGTIVQLNDVLAVGGDAPVLGLPLVSGASVAAEVLDHKRGAKVIAFKKRRRKNSRRKRGYRDEITVIRVTEILTDGKAPSIGPREKKARTTDKAETKAPQADTAAGDTATEKPAAKAKAPAKPKAATASPKTGEASEKKPARSKAPKKEA